MEKILISACFLGEKVRYDGKENKLTNKIIQKWQSENRLISICPEVAGGLNTPRDAAEISPVIIESNKSSANILITTTPQITNKKQILTHKGENVTGAFHRGAAIALNLCLNNGIKFALLKESSPSCGSEKVYDGSFTNIKIAGEGITTEILRKNNIQVFSEKSIEALIAALPKV